VLATSCPSTVNREYEAASQEDGTNLRHVRFSGCGFHGYTVIVASHNSALITTDLCIEIGNTPFLLREEYRPWGEMSITFVFSGNRRAICTDLRNPQNPRKPELKRWRPIPNFEHWFLHAGVFDRVFERIEEIGVLRVRRKGVWWALW
jgi:hypothetical protein